jgi:signal transduction histidine kinase
VERTVPANEEHLLQQAAVGQRLTVDQVVLNQRDNSRYPKAIANRGALNDVASTIAFVALFAVVQAFTIVTFRYTHGEVLRPAKGLLLALCLLENQSRRRRLLLAGALGLLLGKTIVGVALAPNVVSTALALATTIVMLGVCKYLARPQMDFCDWRYLLRFFAVTFLVSVLIGIPAGLLGEITSQGPFHQQWLTWSLGTTLSYCVVAPPMVLLGRGVSVLNNNAEMRRILFANSALLVLLLIVFSQSFFPLTYVVPLGLMGVALVAEIQGVAVGLVLTGLVAISFTVLGYGPGTLIHRTFELRLIAVQFFLLALTTTMLPAAAAVSERRKLHKDLTAALERARLAANVKSEFLANMSHELRTPLASVIGFADALKDHSGLDSRALHYVERVRTASHALLSTVNRVLDYAKLERGELELQPEYFSPHELMQEVLEVFAVQAQSKDLELNLDCPARLAEAILLADANRLRQVLLNIIGNAVKYTERGGVRIRVELMELTGGARLRFDVTDTGPGIEAADLGKLFSRFSQLGESLRRANGGVGLGLAISKAIVSQMGGKIGVHSRPGQGSTFWFEVPVTD